MTSRSRKILARPWLIVLLLAFVVVLGLLAVLLRPVDVQGLVSRPNPAQSYAEAVQRIQVLGQQESQGYNPACRTQFMSQGSKVDRVVVFIHGYTSCPQQFVELGKMFHEAGYNVLIVPQPWHGLADRMTGLQAQLTAGQLTAYADKVVDIAHGLGQNVTVVGISGGGVITGWIAQNRRDVGMAILISPAFGYAQIPPALTQPAANLYLLLPNSFTWWDASLKEAIGPSYAYPRYSTRALAQNLQLSLAVQAQAKQGRPAVPVIIVVTNANDTSVSAPLIKEIVGVWQRSSTTQVRTYEFGAALKLGHDLIDPTMSFQRTDVVYPKLLELASQ